MIDKQLKVVIVGHVDHGKSSLIGRLFHDTDSLPEGKLEYIEKICKKRGVEFEFSFLMDALQSERDQGITIDASQIWFKTKKRKYVIIDAPGHKEFIRNMITGAASSDAAIIIIDAHEGIKEQSKRHAFLLQFLGIKKLIIVFNKMDLIGFDEHKFNQIKSEYIAYLKSLDLEPMEMIPISAKGGDNIAIRSTNTSWYQGPMLVEALDNIEIKTEHQDKPLRFPVQDVYKFDDRRIIAGRLEYGELKVGQQILMSPMNKYVKIASIETENRERRLEKVAENMCVGICFEEQVFIERGDVISSTLNPPIITDKFHARMVWLAKDIPSTSKNYKLKINTSSHNVKIQEIENVIDVDNVTVKQDKNAGQNDVLDVVIKSKTLICLDDYRNLFKTGRFALYDEHNLLAAGIIKADNIHDFRHNSRAATQNIFVEDYEITREEREKKNGHKGAVIWFSGLSGSGKTTLAKNLQKYLFQNNYQVIVLDGDNIRAGINSDLGFEEKDRRENLRRVAEIAKLFAANGAVVITAFISPIEEDRDRAKMIVGDSFHNVYIKASLDICERRDTKGLYKKARAKQIQNFTGISAPFDEPKDPDLVIDTTSSSIDESLAGLIEYVKGVV